MPAGTSLDNLLVPPRLRECCSTSAPTGAREVTSAVAAREGAGFPV